MKKLWKRDLALILMFHSQNILWEHRITLESSSVLHWQKSVSFLMGDLLNRDPVRLEKEELLYLFIERSRNEQLFGQ